MGSDTPQGAWMREYERRRSDLYNAAYDVGDARNGQDEERAEAVAAMARKALDAHVRVLVETLADIARLTTDCPPALHEDGFYRAQLQAAIGRATRALTAPKDAP